MEIFLSSFATEDYEAMASALIEMGATAENVDSSLCKTLAEGFLVNPGLRRLLVLDQRGVGQLIKIATERGRRARPDLKVGICGEHGGEPSSVAFFVEAGLDYVSCSPFSACMGVSTCSQRRERSSSK